MGDSYGPMLVAKEKFTKADIARKKIAVPGTMTSAFLALQLWLDDVVRSPSLPPREERAGERRDVFSTNPHPDPLPTHYSREKGAVPRFDYIVVPFDQIFRAVRSGQADVG